MVSPLKPTETLKDAYPKLNDAIAQSNEAKTKADEALAKAANPIGTLSSAGYKIELSDLSTAVQDAMSGTTGITTAKGYLENNRGVEYPLRNVTRDGQIYTISQTVKDAVLDVKVINAEKGKVYTLAYVSKGNNSSYGFTIYEYDEVTFATNSASSERRVAYYVDVPFSAPTDNVVTRVLDVDGKIFVITIDYSKITTTSLNLSSTSGGVARGMIIDKGCYTYKLTGSQVGIGYLDNNRGVTFPLKNVVKDGVTNTVSQQVKDVLLDVKVINAKQGKYYSISYIANGYNDSWGFSIDEYDKATYGTNSADSKKQIAYYLNNKFSAPINTPSTRALTIDDMIFVITVDYSKFSTNYLNINSSASGQAMGVVIDESCYIFKANQTVVLSERFALPMACKKVGTNHAVKFRYSGTKDMVIEFDLLGVNQITHLKRVYLQDKTYGTIDTNLTDSKTLLYEATSDWISPYRIEALNNGNGNALFTTGANHGTDNGAGFPTASNVETKMYADDHEVKDGESAFVKDKVVIRTVQHVAAYNTIDLSTGVKRDSLKEIVTYMITPRCMNITLEMEALEDLKIRNYSGIQAQKGAWNQTLYYMEDTGKPIKFDISGSVTGESSKKPNGQPDRWVMKKDGNAVVAYYDTSIGLGTRTGVADTEAMFFHTDTKIYGKLIYNPDGQTLYQGNSLYWSGGYAFTPGLECVGAETAYYYYLAGKKVYVVDFFAAANTYLKVEPSDVNKKVTILQKSNSITCDTFVSSRGLKINATGYGQLKFTLD
jgi:hypothetical protein